MSLNSLTSFIHSVKVEHRARFRGGGEGDYFYTSMYIYNRYKQSINVSQSINEGQCKKVNNNIVDQSVTAVS